MANRTESTSARISELPARRTVEPATVSVPDALEKLATATQGMISKRIDLLELDTHELVSGLVTRSALVGFGVVVALAAWLSGLAALVLWLLPGYPQVQQIATFAGVNAVIGIIVTMFALRERLPRLGGEREADLDAEQRQTPA